MKILAIRGKNLASLEGEFEVDFGVEPLLSAGIFAITGHTGSGKSTLLDALCLALFDDTPRNNRATESINIIDVRDKKINQKDSRNILRRGTSDGYAEVDFISLGGERFRSRWSVRRSRDKIDGSLQATDYKLTNLSTGIEVQGRKTELLSKVVQLIGLTFDQFTRAVLLAQGDFATFLKATQREKAELLEKLTGTDIYSRISALIYERTKAVEMDLSLLNERIKDIELLSTEVIESITAEMQSSKPEIERLKLQVAVLSNKISWITEEERINNSIKQAEELVKEVDAAITQATPRYNYIARIDSVQEIRDSYIELRNSEKHLLENRDNLAKLATEREVNAKLLVEATNKVADCEAEREKHIEIVARIEPQIRQARAIDIQIEAAKIAANEAGKDYIAAEKNCKLIIESIRSKEKLLIKETNLIEELRDEQIGLQSIVPAEVIALREKLEDGVPCSVCGSTSHPFRNIETHEKQLEIKDIATLWEKNLQNFKNAEQAIARVGGELSVEREKLTESISLMNEKKEKADNYKMEFQKIVAERINILAGRSADEVEAQLNKRGEEITNILVKLTATRNEIVAKGENIIGVLSRISEEFIKLTEQKDKSKEIVHEWITSKEGAIDLQQLAELVAKDIHWLTAERAALNHLSERKTSTCATLAERINNLKIHQEGGFKPQEDETKENLKIQIEEQSSLLEQKLKRVNEIEMMLENHVRSKARIAKFESELTAKRALTDNWKKLNELFGSADGAKFKVLAQGYTLDALLLYANKHLQELSKRYELQRISDTLALQVVDLDMLGEVRTVHSLSGGESFLISLALALGLSSLSSNKMKVESLFIDEGFGSLDIDTLRVAMDALEQLQTQGRKIGVISHVAEMTERITTQIRVVKRSNGRSKVEIV